MGAKHSRQTASVYTVFAHKIPGFGAVFISNFFSSQTNQDIITTTELGDTVRQLIYSRILLVPPSISVLYKCYNPH